MKKIFKNYLVCLILGVLSIIAALIFAPIWSKWTNCPWGSWGENIVKLLIAVLIICYLVFYLAKKLKGTKKRVILVLTIVEFSLLTLIALGCVISQFDVIKLSDAGKIFALALWIRGCVELFRAYYYKSDSDEVYPVWYLAVSIAMTSFGAYSFATPIIDNDVILAVFAISLILLGSFLFVLSYNNKKAAAIRE